MRVFFSLFVSLFCILMGTAQAAPPPVEAQAFREQVAYQPIQQIQADNQEVAQCIFLEKHQLLNVIVDEKNNSAYFTGISFAPKTICSTIAEPQNIRFRYTIKSLYANELSQNLPQISTIPIEYISHTHKSITTPMLYCDKEFRYERTTKTVTTLASSVINTIRCRPNFSTKYTWHHRY